MGENTLEKKDVFDFFYRPRYDKNCPTNGRLDANLATKPITNPAIAMPTNKSALFAMKFAIPDRKLPIATTKFVATEVRAELICW